MRSDDNEKCRYRCQGRLNSTPGSSSTTKTKTGGKRSENENENECGNESVAENENEFYKLNWKITVVNERDAGCGWAIEFELQCE